MYKIVIKLIMLINNYSKLYEGSSNACLISKPNKVYKKIYHK